MSSMKPDDPFAIDAGKPGSRPAGMQYLYTYQYIFQSNDWLVNILLCALCALIPVIGPIVLIGYQFEIVEALHRNPKSIYPSFDFGRFMDYLVRGVYPFVVSLIASVICVPVMLILIYGPMLLFAIVAGGAGGGNGEAAVLGVFAMFAFIFIAITAFSLLLSLAIMPMFLRGGLSQNFGTMFDFGFVRDFISRVWKEMLLVFLFLMVSSFVVAFLGCAALCVGLFAVQPVMILAYAHAYYQLYELYLSRGGTPIPLKEPNPPRPPAYA